MCAGDGSNGSREVRGWGEKEYAGVPLVRAASRGEFDFSSSLTFHIFLRRR